MIRVHCYKIDKDTKQESKRLLRENLAHYLNTSISHIELKHNKNGKPSIQGMNFSVSHCKHMLVQAFSQTHELGIDIEVNNPNRKYMALAQRYFHPQEFEYLSSLDNAPALTLFYNLWTTKEAMCKVQGGRLWYYLADNYLDANNNILTIFKELKLMQFNEIKHYSLTLATYSHNEKTVFIHE